MTALPAALPRRPAAANGATPRHALPRWPRAARRWPRPPTRWALVAYVLPSTVAGLATLTWFSPGHFVAAGDVSPFLRDQLAAELPAAWSHQLTGAGSPSYEVARLLDVVLLQLTGALGGSPVLAQWLLYAGMTALAAFGTAYLSAVWVRLPWAVAAAGLLGATNVFTLVNQPNLLPTLAQGLVGVPCGLVLRRAARRPAPLGWLLAASVLSSYLAVNPPLLAIVLTAVLGAAVAARPLVGPGGTFRALSYLTRAAPLVLLLNLWWVVPFVQTLLQLQGSGFAAQTDVTGWAWTQTRASLANVVTLNTQWGWTQALYYPFAAAVDRMPFGLLRWMFPGLALLGVFTGGRRLRGPVSVLVLALGLLILLGKGLHPPWGSVNLALYESVPGFWLLRDPMSKLGVLVVLGYGVLAGIALEDVIAWAKDRLRSPRVRTVAVTTPVLLALAYPWPLWTGAVTPRGRGELPGVRVAVPPEWRQLADAVNADSGGGKVLLLPLDPYYQVTTAWGYHGVDSIPQQQLTVPVVQLLPGGYYRGPATFEDATRLLQHDLQTGRGTDVPALLRALGVTRVIVRWDLVTAPGDPPTADPARLSATLQAVPGLRPVMANRVADVYAFDGPGMVSVGSATTQLATMVPGAEASVLATTGTATAVPTGMGADGLRWLVDSATDSTTLRTDAPGWYRLTTPRRAGPYTVRVVGKGPARELEVATTATLTIDNQTLQGTGANRAPLAPGPVVAVGSGAAVVPVAVEGRALTLPVSSTATVTAYTGRAARSVLPDASGLQDCNRYDQLDPAAAGLRLQRVSADEVTLTARVHSACVQAPVPYDPAQSRVVELSFDYRTDGDRPARACLYQVGPGTCAPLPQAPTSGPGWQHFQGYAQVDPSTTALRLYLYADGNGSVTAPTQVSYRAVQVRQLQRLGTALMPTLVWPARTWLTPGEHRLRWAQAANPYRTSAPSVLQDCNRTDPRSPLQAGLRATVTTNEITLGAAAHSACVSLQPGEPGVAPEYRLAVDYRTEQGRPARVCVWQVGPDRCAPTPDLPTGPGWHRLETLVPIEPGTQAVRLYLYADGQESPPTRVSYRNVELRAETGTVVALDPLSPPPAPQMDWQPAGPARYDLHITGASTPFVVRLADSFGRGWALEGLPEGWRATHTTVDGYANGWLVDGRGDAQLRLVYRPAVVVSAAVRVSLATALLVVLVAVSRRGRRAGWRRRRWG